MWYLRSSSIGHNAHSGKKQESVSRIPNAQIKKNRNYRKGYTKGQEHESRTKRFKKKESPPGHVDPRSFLFSGVCA
eukprot:3062864-Amphidinium_carterae.1